MNKKDEKKEINPSIVKRLLRNLYPLLMIFFGIIIILIISLILYSKTEHFQKWANSLLNKNLESILEPGVEFKFNSISISYLLGIEINDFKLIKNQSVVFSADEIHTGFKLLPLLRNKVIINDVLIIKPSIFVARSKSDSIWNVEKLFVPSLDTTPTEPSELRIDLRRLRIIDAKITVFDSTKSFVKSSKFDFSHFILKDFNLNLSSEIDLKNNKYKLNLKKLKFSEINSHYNLNALKMILEIDSNKIDIKNLSYKTEFSDLELEALMTDINVFSERIDLESLVTVFKFKSNSFDLSEISKFIDGVNLNGKTSFIIQGNSKNNNLNLYSKKMSLNNSKLNFKVNVKNPLLENPNFSLYLFDTRIYEKDFRSVLSDLADLDLPNFNYIKINSTALSFHKNLVNAKFDIQSPIVDLDGILNLDLNNQYSYKTNLNIANLNLASLLKNSDLISKINAELSLEGKGNTIDNIVFDLAIKSDNSKLAEFDFKSIIAKVKINEPAKLEIDSLIIQLADNKNISSNHKNLISTDGIIIFKNLNKPIYNLNLKIDDLSIENILSDSSLPETISTNIAISGQGLEADDIYGFLKADYFKWRMNNRTMPDFAFSIKMDTLSNSRKILTVKSKPLDIELKGIYKFTSLISLLQKSIYSIKNQIEQKIAAITLQSNNKSNDFKFLETGEPVNIDLNLKFKDSVLLKELLKFKEFKVDLNLSFDLQKNLNNTKFNINEIKLNQFLINSDSEKVSINNAELKGLFNLHSMGNKDSLTEFDINLKFSEGFELNNLKVNFLETEQSYKNDSIFVNAKSKLLNNIDFNYSSSMAFLPNEINLNIKKLNVNYNDLLKLYNPKDLNIAINSEMIKVNNFDLESSILGKLSLTGVVTQKGFENLNIKFKDFELKELYTFVKDIDKDYLDLLSGKIDSIDVNLNNSFKNTYIHCVTSISGITLNNNSTGKIYSEFQHKDTTITGFVNSYFENGEINRNIFSLIIEKLPLNLSIMNQSERFSENLPIGLSLSSKDIPLDYASPFIKGVRNLKGFADVNLKIKGEDLKSINYSGNLHLKKASYLLEFNNMKYYTNANIELKKDSLLIENITVSNDYYDLKNGKLITSGYVSFDEFDIKNFDIKLKSNQFKLLSNASMKSMPSLYGDFIVALNPVRMYGTPKEPMINGEVNIMSASLTMPSSNTKEVKKSRLIYKYKDSRRVDFEIVKDSLNDNIAQEIATKKTIDFTSALSVDIGIKFKGKFITTMDIAGLGQLFAEIGTNNPEDIIRFVVNKNSSEPSIYGADILVKENSTLKLIKTFNTKGSISFPKGTIDNPSLNLLATYNGQRISSDQISYYTVIMHIRGTKNEPLISFSYSIDGQEAQGDSSKINEDAILLLTLGKTKAELNPSSMTSGNSDFIGSTASSVASTMASSALTDFVQASGFIQSADIDIGNTVTNFDQARMKLSGEIKGIRWTLGGTVADFANNNEISIDIPLAVDLGIDWMNHFILQLTKASNTNQTSTSRSQKDWEIKLKLGGSW